ncbi:MAG: tyrosine-type recombinase/integrase [Deltaproteobacteria bacterium]|nr:tyrosine-type recombinase/integrase [Deltaproteobacteria bacterium]
MKKKHKMKHLKEWKPTDPPLIRYYTDYPGVYARKGTNPTTGKPEDIFYIRYRRDGKRIEEKAGREKQDNMTAARASKILGKIIDREQKPRKELREEIQAAKAATAERWTFEKLWKEYKAGKPDAKRSATDETNFTKHLSPTFGDKEPGEVVPLDVDRLRLSLSKKKAPATVKNVLELLRRLSNFAAKKQLCDPLRFRVTLPKVNNTKTEDLSPEQMARLLGVLRDGTVTDKDGKKTLLDPDAREMMLFALFTGMRRGEIFRLRWDAVDFERGFIRIVEPKGGTDQTIPLPEDARELLEHRPKPEGCPYVFPGRPIEKKKGTPEYFRPKADAAKHFRAIRAAAGLPKQADGKPFRPMHGLRHTFASLLASSGEVDLYTLQRLLTHKSPTMTARYAHLRDETLRRASNVAGRIMRETTAEQDAKKGGAGDAS